MHYILGGTHILLLIIFQGFKKKQYIALLENLFRTVPLEISGRGISQFPKNMKKHLSVVVKKVVDLAQGGCLWGVTIPPFGQCFASD